jgi:inosine/xanthosine triphosphatase
MKIALGTTSRGKKRFLEKALNKKYKDFVVIPVKVDSGVSEQPLTRNETVKGATNRAKSSYKNIKDADWAFGMEGGMQEVNSHYYYFPAVCLFDGKDSYYGLSDSVPLPKEVSDLVKKGGFVGHTIRDYLKKHPDDKSFYKLIKPIIDRDRFFKKSIANVLAIYENKKHF